MSGLSVSEDDVPLIVLNRGSDEPPFSRHAMLSLSWINSRELITVLNNEADPGISVSYPNARALRKIFGWPCQNHTH